MLIKRLILFAAIIAALFVFPQKARADDSGIPMTLYYYQFLDGNAPGFTSETLTVYGNFTDEDRACMLFANFFENYDKDKIPCVPPGTKLLSLEIRHATLIINLSEEVMAYRGGAWEEYLVRQIMRNALEVSGIAYVSLMVEGSPAILPEGTEIWETPVFLYFPANPNLSGLASAPL